MVQALFKQISELKVFVVGDVMLDCYWWGNIDRISPEAPVPILSLKNKDERPGGAANVALNVKSFGCETHLYTVLGLDETGKKLKNLIELQGILTDGILESENRPTTSKTRLLSRNQQLARIDEEVVTDIKEEHAFIDFVLKGIQRQKPDIVIIEDYNKGILTEYVIQKIITHAQLMGSLVAVDPKSKNFLQYKNVDLFKPNWKEVLEAVQDNDMENYSLSHLQSIHEKLKKELNHKNTIITLSDKGAYYANDAKKGIIPAHVRNISDVSGAGDSVISVAALFLRVTNDIELTTKISNLAGGMVCEEVGVVPIDKKKLIEEIRLQNF